MCVAFDNIQCYAGIGEYLSPEDTYAMAASCKSFKRSRECDIMERLPQYPFSIRLHISGIKTIYPPLQTSRLVIAETACDKIKRCELPSSVDGPVVCVEGSDMMGLNLHRGVQGGRCTCQCYKCNAKTLDNLNTGISVGTQERTLENCRGWHKMHEDNPKCNATDCANTHKPPIYICPYTVPVPLHLVLGCTNTLRDYVVEVCTQADIISPSGAAEDIERTIDELENNIEDAEGELCEARAVTKRLRQFLPKAGFDPTDLLQMGNAAKQSTATTLLGACIKKRFDGTWYGGEVVAYLGEESGRQGGWKIKYDDGDEEGMNRAALENLLHRRPYWGEKYPSSLTMECSTTEKS